MNKNLIAIIMTICMFFLATGVLYCLWDGRIDIRVGNVIVIEGKGDHNKVTNIGIEPR